MHHNQSTNNDQRKTRNERLKTLAIIPARGGSKGVPGKNIKTLDGKPLIQYAVDCALDSNEINKIVVNSDDTDILDTVDSRNSNQIIKQKRPQSLGQDNSSIVDVAIDALNQLNENFDIVLLLQVTSPLRSANDISKIINLFKDDDDLEGVVSVVPMDDMHPARMYNVDKDQGLNPLIENAESLRRQDLKPVYYRNGCFYAVKYNVLNEQKTFMPQYKKAYIMNPNFLLNIDSYRDLKLAEILLPEWQKQNK